jgi:hypothetical protein
MNTLDAHARFCLRPDGGHGLLHPDGDPDIAPAFCTALAVLSGMMPSCESDADLDEAVTHGLFLLAHGILTQADFHREVRAVFDAVAVWGLDAEAELMRQAERN